MFKEDAKPFDDADAKDCFNSLAISAAADGDVERAQALNSVGEALIADARKAGTDAVELTAALNVVRERQGDTLSPITPEKMEADFATGMAAVEQEYDETYMADLNRRAGVHSRS